MGHTVVACVTSAAAAMTAVQAHCNEVVLWDSGLPGPQDGLLVGLDIQTFWSTPVIYRSGSEPTQLGLPEFPEALWCYVAKLIDWEQLCAIVAQLLPADPFHSGALASDGEDRPALTPRSPRIWTTEARREHLRRLRQPAGALERDNDHRAL
jgi:hypothetical protein